MRKPPPTRSQIRRKAGVAYKLGKQEPDIAANPRCRWHCCTLCGARVSYKDLLPETPYDDDGFFFAYCGDCSTNEWDTLWALNIWARTGEWPNDKMYPVPPTLEQLGG